MNPLPECCFPHSAPIPHQFVMKVYVDAWIYVTEKFVNMGNIELYEGVLRYEKADYPPIPNFIRCTLSLKFAYRQRRHQRSAEPPTGFQCTTLSRGGKGLWKTLFIIADFAWRLKVFAQRRAKFSTPNKKPANG